MSNSIKEVFNDFLKKKMIGIRVDGKRTSICLPEPLYKAAAKYCIDKGISMTQFCVMIDKAKPVSMLRTEAIRIVFYELYYNEKGFDIND